MNAHFSRWIAFVLLLGLPVSSCSQERDDAASRVASDTEPVVRYGVTVRSGPMDSVLLKDYAPEPSLVVAETHLPRARYPVIDVHTHVYARTAAELDEWVRTMDDVGIDVTVVLTGATGEEFDQLAKLYLERYPDRFQLYCGLDTDDVAAPDYPERAVRELVRCYEMGARGVGEVSDKGWGLGGSPEKHLPRGERLHPDDRRLDPFWEKCAELDLPVNLHIADHPSCWKPLGPNWERTPDFQGFNLFGKNVPSHEELLQARDRLLAEHSGTTFIACHLSNQGHDLTALSETLERFPNLFLDISARDYELGRQPRASSAFLEQFKNRVVFGTDMGREKHMYEGWWRLLESSDEFIPGRLWWRLYGLDLQPEVLESIYRGTALEVLNRDPLQQAAGG